MRLILTRTGMSPDASVGELEAEANGFHAFTIEQPWRENLIGQSCVPEGDYELLPYASPKHGATWCLHNPALNIYAGPPFPQGARTYCEIHSANWAEELQGCIAIGLEGQPMYDPLTGRVEPAIEDSHDAVWSLIQLLGHMSRGHTLTIRS